MLIGVPLETTVGETRVAVTPETTKKLKAQGHTVRVQAGAGVSASATDEAYQAAGAEIVDRAGAFGCELVLKVRSPQDDELAMMKPGTTLVGMLNPFDAPGLQRLASAGLTSFALEAAPRTTRAQSMDVLSSQANIAGYKAVMIAADRYQRLFPMLMTAAGTIKAARAVVSSSESSVGAGSPRRVSVISRLRRVAGSMRTMRSVSKTLAQISPFTNSSSLSLFTGWPFIVTSMRPVSCNVAGSSLRIWCVPSLM
jgi:NAD(P) transhydrogenase subunit alpha